MNPTVKKLMDDYYTDNTHPYHKFESDISSLLGESKVLLDAGCGTTAPVLTKFVGKCRELIGVDLVDFAPVPGVKLLNQDLGNMEGVQTASVDLIISRSVLEHVKDVQNVYREFQRVLKPDGRVVLLVPNLCDYVSVISYLVPNGLHKHLVAKTTARPEEDTFPTFYKSNTRGAIEKLAGQHSLQISRFEYLRQDPHMLKFSPSLYRLGIWYDNFVCRRFPALSGWILCELRKEG